MLSIIVQPKSWQYKTYEEIDRITILKFSRNALYEDDLIYETVFDGKEIDQEIVEKIIKNLKNHNVVTYNGRLLSGTMHLLCEHYNLPETENDNIIGLMEIYGELHNNNKWAKLQDALYYYDINEIVDIYDPFNMAKNTFLLYRAMEDEL